MMLAVAAAAGGERRVFDSSDADRKRCQAKEKNEEDGESAPHLEYMLHELWNIPRFERG